MDRVPIQAVQSPPRTARIVVGHGSRSAAAQAAFEAFVAQYRRRHPTERISSAHLELAEPRLPEALAEAAHGVERVVLLPLFLFAAGHVKNDLPLAVAACQRAHPEVHFAIGMPIGVDPHMVAVLGERMEAALAGEPLADTLVLVVGRGSSDPNANADFCKLVRLFAEGYGLRRAEPCFEAIAEPQIADGLELLIRARPKRIVILPYMLFGGRLVERIGGIAQRYSAQYPWIRFLVAEPIGLDPRLLQLFDERAASALGGGQALPCGSCQYRAPLGRIVEHVGGLRALMYSARHSLTHAQAANHEHAHRPIKQHILICGNVDCAARGSLAMLSELRRCIKRAGLQRTVKVTRTSCMGQCGEGPTVAVYPDGVWYRGVTAPDAGALVDEHLLAGRIVARLVDNIMT